MTTTNPEIERLVEEVRHSPDCLSIKFRMLEVHSLNEVAVVGSCLDTVTWQDFVFYFSPHHDLQWFVSKQPFHPDHLARVFGVEPGSHEANVLSAIQRVFSERYHQQQEKP